MSTVTFSTVLLPVPLNDRTPHEQTAAWLLADLAVAPAFGDDYCACLLCLLRLAKTLGPKALLAKYDLTYGMASVPKTAEEVRKGLEAVKRSEAGCLVVIAGHSYMNDDLILPLITDSIRVAAELGLYLSWETHRAALTESP